MQLSRRIGVAALALAAVGVMAARRPGSAQAKEVARIQAHFDGVLVELETRDVRALLTTCCAVAILLDKTGRGDIVERVRAANNNVLVMQPIGF